jgi:hypothetical protein
MKTWSRFFDAYEPVHALVGEDAGNLLGLVHFLFHRSTISVEPVCYPRTYSLLNRREEKAWVAR